MAHLSLVCLFAVSCAVLHAYAAASADDSLLPAFEDFVRDYGRVYETAAEYERRSAIYEANLETIRQQNANPSNSHRLGVNQFADLEAHERPKGLLKQRLPGWTASPNSLVVDGAPTVGYSRQGAAAAALPFSLDAVEDLPAAVDWSKEGVSTPVKSQGGCGSCWAFASTAVLESHVALATGKLFGLSPQVLVSCSPNPQDCGGTGGCDGSTGQLAFDTVVKHGMLQEWDFGYQASQGEKINCTLRTRAYRAASQASSQDSVHSSAAAANSSYYERAVVSIDGYVTLPANSYVAMMNAVAKMGPVAISVAASPWDFYRGGIFDLPMNATAATDINHLVSLEGYGTDPSTGEDYWLVKNSWSPLWGENGYIRLKRVDPGKLDTEGLKAFCGVDTTPGDGDACTKDKDGNDIDPPNVTVCGTSGVLYQGVLPLGAHLV